MSKNMNICPICDEGPIHETSKERGSVYKGVENMIPMYFSVCDACGSEQVDAAQSRKNKQVMIAFKKEVDGLLTGEQIKALRTHCGITQSQAAKIFGGGPVAFSKYEADDVTQSEAMDKLLRVTKAVPSSFAWLAKRAGENEVSKSFMQKTISSREKLMRRHTRIEPSAQSWKMNPSNAALYSTTTDTARLVVG